MAFFKANIYRGKMNEEFDPTIEVGISGMGMSEEETAEAVANIQAADAQKAVNNEVEVEQEEVAKEIVKPEGHTIGDYAADTLIGAGSGFRKGVGNIITAPERVIDYFNGEMAEEEATEEGYQPEWDDFMYGDGDPIVTKTWWGDVVESISEVGTTAGLTLGVGGKVLGAKKLTGSLLTRELKRGALIGGTFSTLDQNETGEQNNILGQIAERYPHLRTPLATKDADSPVMRKLKFVLEDLGIGAVFDVALMGLLPVAGKGIQQVGKATVKGTDAVVGGAKEVGAGLGKLRDEVLAANPEDLTGVGQQVRNVLDTDIDSLRSDFAEYTQARRNSVETQTKESVKAQLKEPGVRFPKNEPIGSRELGNSTSNHTAADVDKAIQQKKTQFGSEDGHVGSMTTNQQIEDVAKGRKKPEDLVKAIVGDFKGEKYMEGFEQVARETGRSLNEVVAENMSIFKEIYEGRNTSELTSKQFYERLLRDKTEIKAAFKDPKTGKVTQQTIATYVKPEYIKALDMVNLSLFNDIQSQSIVGRELADITDIKDIDGPVHHLVLV